MCGGNKDCGCMSGLTEKLLVVASARAYSGTPNNFQYLLPENTRFKKIALVNVAMTLPIGVNGVCINVSGLPRDIQCGGTSPQSSVPPNDCTFYVPNNQTTAINFTVKEETRQEMVFQSDKTLSLVTVTVTDEMGVPITLPGNWSMMLRIN